jgi:hypothetical protein
MDHASILAMATVYRISDPSYALERTLIMVGVRDEHYHPAHAGARKHPIDTIQRYYRCGMPRIGCEENSTILRGHTRATEPGDVGRHARRPTSPGSVAPHRSARG